MIVKQPAALFDLKSDEGETADVTSRYPEVVARLSNAADGLRKDLGDKLKKIKGTGVRKVGVAE